MTTSEQIPLENAAAALEFTRVWRALEFAKGVVPTRLALVQASRVMTDTYPSARQVGWIIVASIGGRDRVAMNLHGTPSEAARQLFAEFGAP